MNETNTNSKAKMLFDTRKLVFTAMLAAVAAVLMMFSFKIPLVPSFLSFDFSDFPAVMASLTMGPISGVFVCLVKNIINLPQSMTGGVGELSNFILSCTLVIPAGIIGRKIHTYKGAIIGCIIGCVAMALLSIASNYFVVYPIYQNIMPIEAIIGMYKEINPNVNGLLECLIVFNCPFTFAKGFIASVLCLPLYKALRPVFNSYYRR
ncbi:MAG: ECF transporter S component [Ruminococcaceae bacterium]|nr:ECF transporter S component [Oscillospiraceae bacterium]